MRFPAMTVTVACTHFEQWHDLKQQDPQCVQQKHQSYALHICQQLFLATFTICFKGARLIPLLLTRSDIRDTAKQLFHIKGSGIVRMTMLLNVLHPRVSSKIIST